MTLTTILIFRVLPAVLLLAALSFATLLGFSLEAVRKSPLNLITLLSLGLAIAAYALLVSV